MTSWVPFTEQASVLLLLREKERQRDRKKERDRQTDRQRETERDKDRETETDTERQRKRENNSNEQCKNNEEERNNVQWLKCSAPVVVCLSSNFRSCKLYFSPLIAHSSQKTDGGAFLFVCFVFWTDDRLYSAILRSLEQTHCACGSTWMTSFIARFLLFLLFCFVVVLFEYPPNREVMYLQRWHGWCHMKLQPSRCKYWVHHTTMHHVTSCKATYVRSMRV